MVTAEESTPCRQFAALNSLYSDNMALLHFPPVSTSDVAFLGHPNSELCGLDTMHLNAVSGFGPYPTEKANPEVSLCFPQNGLGIPEISSFDDGSDVPQKRFLIFDQSGSQTRMFLSPSFSPQNHVAAAKAIHENVALQLDQQEVIKENWDENHISDREDEMVENSEEIDALFFSDDDDDDYDDTSGSDCDSDEVTSKENKYYKEILLEESAGPDGAWKRQKLLNSRCRKVSSLERTSGCTYEDGVESSCSSGRKSCNKRVKVRAALKRLEGIIPGLNSKDPNPIDVIEKAIDFLKSMRMEAEALGVGCNQKVP